MGRAEVLEDTGAFIGSCARGEDVIDERDPRTIQAFATVVESAGDVSAAGGEVEADLAPGPSGAEQPASGPFEREVIQDGFGLVESAGANPAPVERHRKCDGELFGGKQAANIWRQCLGDGTHTAVLECVDEGAGRPFVPIGRPGTIECVPVHACRAEIGAIPRSGTVAARARAGSRDEQLVAAFAEESLFEAAAGGATWRVEDIAHGESRATQTRRPGCCQHLPIRGHRRRRWQVERAGRLQSDG